MAKVHHRSSPSKSKSNRRRSLRIEQLEGRRVLATWAGTFGGADLELTETRCQESDLAGGTYVGGHFISPSFDADPGPGVTTLVNSGSRSGFLSKFDQTGNLAWANKFGGTGFTNVWSTDYVAETNGNFLYVTGLSSGTANFGSFQLGGRNSSSIVYLAKVDASSGNVVFAKSLGSADLLNSQPPTVKAGSGKVFLVGSFNSTFDFDPGAGTANLTPIGKGKTRPTDGFIWTLDTNGNYVAATRLGGSGADIVQDIVVDGTLIVVSGTVEGTVDLDPSASTQNANGIFMAKYGSGASPIWVQSFGGSGSTYLQSSSSDVYLSGTFFGSVDMDGGPGTASFTADALGDAFVAKYAKSSGALQWAEQYASSDWDNVNSVAIDELSGNLYFAGFFNGPAIDFSPSAPGGELFQSGGSSSFLVRLDSNSGAFENAWQFNSPSSRTRIAGLIGTTVYLAGYFDGTMAFPNGAFATSAGKSDCFVMALDDATAFSPSTSGRVASTHSSKDQALLAFVNDWDGDFQTKRKRR